MRPGRRLALTLASVLLCVGGGFARGLERRPVLSLRPGQFAVGEREVAWRVEKLQSMSRVELRDYLKEHPVPVVAGPQGRHYIVDQHHHARAAWEAGADKVWVKKAEDFSHLSENKFWKAMRKAKLVYLFDQFGNRRDPSLLPTDIRGLADDPYRGLAWGVRSAGGYDKVKVPFSEFRWANFFRRNVPIELVTERFDKAVRVATKLAKSRKAARLPGFKGR